MAPTQAHITELLHLKMTLANLQPFKYTEDLRTFERQVAAGTITAAAVTKDLEILRPLVTRLTRTYRAMTRGRGTVV